MRRLGIRAGAGVGTALALAVSACVVAQGRGVEENRDDGPGPRVEMTINEGWRYADGDHPGASAPGFDDGDWERVDLPHTWNADAAGAESPDYRRGVGWYRTRLAVPSSLGGKRLFLRFEGANQVAEVFVNGTSVGRHVGGYTAFAFEVTELLRPGGDDVVAVRVDNAHDADIPPLDADFTFYGGIYRDVWLIATEPVHVTLLDHASPGIRIDTPELDVERGTVRVRGTVVNATGEARRADVTSRVLDPGGATVAVLRADIGLPASGSTEFEQLSQPILGPRLWSPAEPNLYRVVTEVREGDRLMDRVENPLGFRWFDADPARGFLLNGRPHQLIGTNRHQDRAGYGNALPDDLHRRDIEIVRATGFDLLRLAHYPQDPAVLEAMDREGLVGWEEIPVVNTITLSDAFGDTAERMLVEMIRQHYNHPSIVFWGYMNEIMLREPDPRPADYRERVVELGRRLEAVVKREDPTRLSATAISFGEIDNGTGFQDIPDVLGFNLYFGWYYRDLEGLGVYLDSLHARHPDRPLMISEYGAGSDERIHALDGVRFDFSTEYQRLFHEVHLPQILEREYLVGAAVWNQFDFGSAGRHDSKPNINQKGLLYYDRTPKDVWHYYRALLLDEPVLHIATRDWRHRAGSRPGDAAQPIAVYSNLDRVELSVNGESLGTRPVENGTARWTVELAPGPNRLVARGTAAAGGVRDETVVTYVHRASDIAVNAGSHYQYVDGSGVVWEADRAYEPGGWGHVGGEDRLSHRRIAGTDEDALFQATREGAEAYRFDVPDGEYEVRLLLADTRYQEAGERVLDVRVNGLPVFSGLDLVDRHGANTAVERTVRVSATDGAGIVVRAAAQVGTTTLSGVALRRR
jgi:beta-galactosidase